MKSFYLLQLIDYFCYYFNYYNFNFTPNNHFYS